uniref:PAH-inducible cytochrome P450 monooxygenase PC-PAH 2 n=1 Tax=Phanerodontia chrysosporium TaxID=2822231 RepID=E2DYW9_PHACH|nr:PAH-inducible cytochrome P450 monooxygenase PC-PAH 2 [Phanerodontia chrysosporium]
MQACLLEVFAHFPPVMAVLLVVLLLILTLFVLVTRKSSRHYPPGPRPLPLLGNIHNAPAQRQWKTFAAWKSTYGDVISLTIFGQRIVVLNSLESAIDLLEKRSAVYSDRPRMVMVGELLGWAQQLVFAPYGEHFRNMRKILHKYLGARGQLDKIEPYHEIIEAATAKFLVRALRDDSDFHLEHNVHMTSGTINLRIGYGHNIAEGDDELVQMMDDALVGFNRAAVPGAFLVDIIPALKWVPTWCPGTSWKRQAQEWKDLFVRMTEGPYAMAQQQAERGGHDNIVSMSLSEDMSPEDHYDLKMAVGSLYGGGTDTTVAIILSFILAMTLHPEAQKKAQKEIDALTNGERLPVIRDREELPYVRALISEVLRWNPLVPLGVPHRAIADDVYRGYFIPEGSTIVVNMWQLAQDPEVYADPEVFKPERFLGPDSERDIRTFVFGFGRRICPGLNLAEASTFAICARILAVFEIGKVVEDGKRITPDFAFRDGAVRFV